MDGVLSDDCDPGIPQEYDDCNGLDEDCDGRLDEGEGPLASLQIGVCEGNRKICDFNLQEWIEPDHDDSESLCDGLDNDCDGEIDEDLVGSLAPLADLQNGVCVLTRQVCTSGRWVEPVYSNLHVAYEEDESLCDGRDNDCDGEVDEGVVPPLADLQNGICTGSNKVCGGFDGWLEPEYDMLFAQFEEEESACDGVDSDCDGVTDEGVEAPLAVRQVGVCAGTVKVCDGVNAWIEPVYGNQRDAYEMDESLCDGLDNDCDGALDEALVVPPADLQDGVCNGLTKVSCDGVNGWVEPDYEALDGYLW